MQFVENGPDLPIELLDLRDKGELVFFCGAGVSMSAGLPSFKGLVCNVANELNTKFKNNEKIAIREMKYDIALQLLENRIPDTRKVIVNIIKNLNPKKLQTHKAILDLALTRNGEYRVVTTNFDNGFFKNNKNQLIRSDNAPLLRVPKFNNWKNLVYLHGKIDESNPTGENLIFTSSDFGRAYLTERWASRFVTELFRNFSVIFVGYSINDPVMRYLMDAISYDRKIREEYYRKAFIIDHVKDDVEIKNKEKYWSDRGLDPIIYTTSKKGHEVLHNSIRNWAKRIKNGSLSKVTLVQELSARSNVLQIDESSADVQQVIWALKDKGGNPAKAFSNLDPTPPFNWIDIFEKNGLLSSMVDEVGMNNCWVGGFRVILNAQPLSKNSRNLIEWFCKHLDVVVETRISEHHNLYSNKALQYILSKGGLLNREFAYEIIYYIEDNKVDKPFAKIWSAIAQASINYSDQSNLFFVIYKLFEDGKIDEIQFKAFIFKCFQPVYSFRSNTGGTDKGSVNSYVKANIKIGDENSLYLLKSIFKNKNHHLLVEILPMLFNILEMSWDMLYALGQINKKDDYSYLYRTTIKPNKENFEKEKWNDILDLIYFALEVIASKKDYSIISEYINRCLLRGFPLFERIAISLSSFIIYDKRYQEDLVEKIFLNKRILWCNHYFLEICNLLEKIELFESKFKNKIIREILKGPILDNTHGDINGNEREVLIDRHIYDYINKIQSSNEFKPNNKFNEKSQEIIKKYPEWLRKGEESRIKIFNWDEDISKVYLELLDNNDFFDNKYNEWESYILRKGSSKCIELAEYVRKINGDKRIWKFIYDPFRKLCEGEKAINNFWSCLNKDIKDLDDSYHHRISFLFKEDAEKINKETFLKLFYVCYELFVKLDSGLLSGDTFDLAINHPVGHLSEALLQSSWPEEAKKGEGFERDYFECFKLILCDRREKAIHGKAILVSRASIIYWLDPCLFTKHMRNLFLKDEKYYISIWDSFTYSNKFSPDLLSLLKNDFIFAFSRVTELSDFAVKRMFKLLTIYTLDNPDILGKNNSRRIIQSCETKYLSYVIRILEDRVVNSENPREIWDNSILKFINYYWPKDIEKRSSDVSYSIAKSLLELKSGISEDIEKLINILTIISFSNLGNILHHINQSCIYQNYAKDLLRLLNIITPEEQPNDIERHNVVSLRSVINSLNEFKGSNEWDILNERLGNWGF